MPSMRATTVSGQQQLLLEEQRKCQKACFVCSLKNPLGLESNGKKYAPELLNRVDFEELRLERRRRRC